MARKPTGIDIRHTSKGIRYRVRWRQGGGRDGAGWGSHTFTKRADAISALQSIELAGWRCYCPKHCPPGAEPGRYGAAGVVDEQTWGAYAHRRATNLTGVGSGYRAQFARDLDRHMAPLLPLTFEQVTKDRVQEWIRGLERKGLSPTTISRLVVQAGSVQRAAVEAGLGHGQPFAKQRVGRVDRDQHTEMVCLTPAQWAPLQAALPEGTYRDLCTVLVGTGLRFGEVTALAVGAVDLPGHELHVSRAWKADGSNGFEMGVPKSRRSRRTVTFGTAVADALARQVAGREGNQLVFTTPAGAPVRNSNFAYRVWKPAVRRAGLPREPRIHDLRHTHASWLIAAGWPVTYVSRRLGHESVQTTDAIYTHILPNAAGDDVAALDRIMPADGSPAPPGGDPD